MVFRHADGEIAWGCDEGVITGWEGSPTDVSGGCVASEVNAEVERRRARLLDEACALLEAALDAG